VSENGTGRVWHNRWDIGGDLPLMDLSVAILSIAAAQSSTWENSTPLDRSRSFTAGEMMVVGVYLCSQSED
jgi:hypothetical protein